MVADLALSLYEIAKSSIFATRRTKKGINGDPTSFAVASAQVTKAVKNTANWNNAIGNTAKTCVEALETASKAKTLTGYAAKALNVASSAVNPLIVTTGAIKVACANDKTTEAINQGCALTAMFAAEKTAYRLLTPSGRALVQNSKLGQKKVISSVLKTMQDIDKYAAGAKTTKVGKIGIPLLKAAAFVCASIGGYALGSELADKINETRGVHVLAKQNKSTPQKKTKENLIDADINTGSLEYIS